MNGKGKKSNEIKETDAGALAIKKALPGLPPLSHYASRKEWEHACWQKILNSETLKDILGIAVTSYERHNLIIRVAAIGSIISGKKSGEIAKELWLSPQTISSIKKSISGTNYRSYRETGKTARKKKVYSRDTFSMRKRHRGRPVRTKYGTVYLPY